MSERDLRRAEFLAVPFAIIALLLVFRSVVASILPALVGGGAVVVSLALIFALGHVTTLSIFVLTQTALAQKFGLCQHSSCLITRSIDSFIYLSSQFVKLSL